MLPDFTDYSMKNRTYRYAANNVLYPFGYGLTYGKMVCTSVEYADGKAVVTAENTGSEPAEDVIQLYVKDYCENAVPNVSLCGFRRVTLAAGEKKLVEIAVPERAFTAVDDNGKRSHFGSRFTLYAGTHQPDERSEQLCGTKCVRTEIRF